MRETEMLSRLIGGYRHTALVGVAARLRLADHVTGGAHTATELAEATGARPDMLSHLLRALAALGVLEIDDAGVIRLTQMGELLRDGHPGRMRQSAAYAATVSGPAFDGLYASMLDGTPAFVHRFGVPFYERVMSSAELARNFTAMLRIPGFNERITQLMAPELHGTIYDIGGGDGLLLLDLLNANGSCRGVLFETPQAARLPGGR